MNRRQQGKHAWHSLDVEQLGSTLGCSLTGLHSGDAAARLKKYGANQLPQKPPTPLWQVVSSQFRSPLIYILAAAAVISVFIGDIKDASFIAAVLVINAIIGAYHEWRAEQSAHALQKLLKIQASVERDGEVREIDAAEVVPGDIIWLESGNRVPADVRLLTAHGLEVDESLLTGESLPVTKDPTWLGPQPTVVADRLNMTHAGSIVTRGRSKGVVVATGIATVVGELAVDVLGTTGGKPPLLARMERFTHVIAVVVLVAATAIGILGVALGRYDISEMFLFTVALAVSAIPEGLPVAMTVALAIATTRMSRRGVIVRRLTAVEGLGSCTLIATDKTGTLTCNELMVRDIRLPSGDRYEATGEGFHPNGQVLEDDKVIAPGKCPALRELTRAGVLCNEADLHQRNGDWISRGDAVDIALLVLGHKLGWDGAVTLDKHPRVNQIPFEPERQFAASYNTVNGAQMVFIKGAPERILAMCSDHNGASIQSIQETAESMAAHGYRVIAFADGWMASEIDASPVPPEPEQLRFLGLVGMIDPLRPGVRDAVSACHSAGVSVTMVTGDHRVTALAIARDLGLATDESQVATGTDLMEKSERELGELINHVRVFARVGPRQKLQLVDAARAAGHFVAVTGDGVNDAPALRTANIGVAMGKSGTDVAREAAELVLSDDNFATIVTGIEEGRIAYDNVRKVIYLLISTGAAELVLMALAIITGSPLPLLPVQILWLNLVTNGIQDVALAFEPGEGDVLQRKPRPPQERIFNRLMIERTLIAAMVMGIVGFGAFRWMLQNGWTETAARNALLLLMVLFENVHIGNCRSETTSAFTLSPLKSPILLLGAACAFLIHIAAMYTPWGQAVLDTGPVGITTWAALAGLALLILPAMELHKFWRRTITDGTPRNGLQR